MLSQHQKFHKSSLLAQELASLASEVGMAEFKSRFGLLKRLRDVWAEGKRAVVTLQVMDEESSGMLQRARGLSNSYCIQAT